MDRYAELMDTLERLWEKIDRRGPDECWPWTASTVKGYGRFNLHGRLVLAHRLIYMLLHGPLPAEVLVLHSCDNPPCCNPAHLRPGDHQANKDDSVSRRRHRAPRGEQHGRAKLTASQVGEIRQRREAGETLAALASEYGVSKSSVSRAARGDTWVAAAPSPW